MILNRSILNKIFDFGGYLMKNNKTTLHGFLFGQMSKIYRNASARPKFHMTPDEATAYIRGALLMADRYLNQENKALLPEYNKLEYEDEVTNYENIQRMVQ